jgi:uncharacterized protein (TIGR00730 family)
MTMTGHFNTPFPAQDKAVCIFCGSSEGKDPAFAAAAEEMGRRLAEAGYSMVFGGGDIGLMGETARAVRKGGRRVRGILPEFLSHLEPPMPSGETVELTADLQERKRRMLELAQAFIILPGGLGTLDEFFEVVTSAQLGVFAKPIVVLDTKGYYAPLKALMEHVVVHGFAKPDSLRLYRFVATPKDAIAALRAAFAVEG